MKPSEVRKYFSEKQYPQIVSVNTFIETICSVQWFEAKQPEEWMVVNNYPSIAAAWAAVRPGVAAWSAARAAAGAAAWDAGWSAAAAAAEDAARAAARAAVMDAARAAAWDADVAAAAARAAAADAAGAAYSLIVADIIDTTWLVRWWKAWELGYYPITERGDHLVVGRIEKP